MIKKILVLLLLVNVVFAHEHGIAKLDIFADGTKISMDLDSPMNNFLSFEHKPQTKEEKKEYKEFFKRIKKEEIFVFNSDCKKERKHHEKHHKEHHKESENSEHEDIELNLKYKCKNEVKTIEVNLFKMFPNLKQIDVQLSGKKQKSYKLNKDNNIITIYE
ncbi:MAG: hypothetical protein Ta2D_06760 [Rickettsiales bacterium]|nr:MAG: hypothetical protein Ta2D_06760 [Rickettsiales bacterium]